MQAKKCIHSMGTTIFQRNHYSLLEYCFTRSQSGFISSTAKVAGAIMQITFVQFIINA